MTRTVLVPAIVWMAWNFGAAPLAAGEKQMPSTVLQEETSAALDMLLSDDRETRQQGRERIREARAEMIRQLVTVISDPKNHVASRAGSVEEAMFVLGDLRAVEAVDALIAQITFPKNLPWQEEPRPQSRTSQFRITFLPSERRLAAVSALVQIGEPCVDKVIERIATTDKDDGGRELRACALVLKWLRDRTPVDKRLQRAIENAEPPQRRRLKQAQKLLDKEPPSAEELKELLEKLRQLYPPGEDK